MLEVTPQEAREDAKMKREAMLRTLQEQGYLDPAERTDEQRVIEAMNCYICSGSAQLVCVSLADALGERRLQNQPGTDQEYPNWRIPLGDGSGKPVSVEQIWDSARFRSLANAVEHSINQ